MKTYSLDELKKMGAEVAAFNGVTKLIASSDGNFFTPENVSYAKLHKRTNPTVELFDIDYGDTYAGNEDKTKSVKKSASEKIEEISKLETLEAIENYIKGEKAVSVIAAADKRKEELIAAENATDAANGRK